MIMVNIILLLLLGTMFTTQVVTQLQETPLRINCGLPKSSEEGNRIWRGDEDPAFAPPNMNSISSVITDETASEDPYKTARLFHSPLTYTFSLQSGPKFIRLYFSNNSNTISLNKSYMSLQVNNNLTLLQYFNPFLNTPQPFTPKGTPYEFHITLQNGTLNLNLTFSPGDILTNSTTDKVDDYYGFINGIEIMSIPEGLYINETKRLREVRETDQSYPIPETAALQTAFRINVGGATVQSGNDSGGMMRVWYRDQDYLINDAGTVGSGEDGLGGTTPSVNYTSVPRYVAPPYVYATVRVMANETSPANLKTNLTWGFGVDPGFDYLIRLHFCERTLNINGTSQRMFSVYIDGVMMEEDLDVWQESGGQDIPMYKDYYVDTSGGVSNGTTRVPLTLALHPQVALKLVSSTLSGVEILKVSLPNGSLAVPSQKLLGAGSFGQGSTGNSKQHSLPIILGIIGGGLLAALAICAGLFLYRRQANNKAVSTTKSSSKAHYWFPTSNHSQSTINSNNASSGPSLPSDLCRRFSFDQIRVATFDFENNLIIGTGGFGKVYRGTIDGGEAVVAIKRLTSTSKQGVREFQTEIEMLSRLRHVHLVSLIGYCEEHGEMILVYEYMTRGTLRDHLGYKDDKNNENNEVLSWKQRLMICLGSARGLDYLHAGAKDLIIHRDVKSTNILLDDKWTAKVSDFGLSKVGPAAESGTGHVSTVVKGSFGYLDPEYYRRQQLTEKSDVYSFGVVLFEVLCARPVVNPQLPREQVNLASWGRNRYRNGTLHTIVDPKIAGQIAPECLRKFGEIAEMCVRDHGSDRPSMRDVVWSLEFALQLQETAENNNFTATTPTTEIPSSNTNIANGGYDGTTDEDMFSNSSLKEPTQVSTSGVGTWKAGSSSATSDAEYLLKSEFVFSEIIDPQAR